MWKTEKQVSHIYHKRPSFPRLPQGPTTGLFLLLFREERNSQIRGLETNVLIVVEKETVDGQTLTITIAEFEGPTRKNVSMFILPEGLGCGSWLARLPNIMAN
jgi:hypothetical protein